MPDGPAPPRIPSTARHYAKALVELAEAEGSYQKWSDRLTELTRLTEGTELGRTLASPEFSMAQRRELSDAVLGQEPEVDLVARNLMRLLIEGRRTRMLGSIAAAYRELVERREGRVTASLTTAIPISPVQLEEFSRELSERIGQAVSFRAKVDAELLGGAVVRVGDRVFDASLRTRLQQLRQRMLTEAGAI